MVRGPDPARRDLRLLRAFCLGTGAGGVLGAIVDWAGEGRVELGAIFLVLTVLLAPTYLLLARDLRRRVALRAGEQAPPSTVRPAGRAPGGGLGRIVVVRPRGFHQDALRSHRIVVGGEEAGRVRRGEQVEVVVAAGRHEVAARIDWSGSPPEPVDVPPGGAVTVTVVPGSPLRGFVTGDGWLSLSVGR